MGQDKLEGRYRENEGLVYYVICRYFGNWVGDEDVAQAGKEGLWRACIGYEERRGKFSTYAVWCVRNSIRVELRRSGKGLIGSSGVEGVSEDSDICVVGIDLGRQLTAEQRRTVRLRLQGKTQREIGAEEGVSHTVIYRRLKKIREKMEMS